MTAALPSQTGAPTAPLVLRGGLGFTAGVAPFLFPPAAAGYALLHHCRRGLEKHEEGLSGDGLEGATVREAQRLADGEPPTDAKIQKAVEWWGRNERFLDAEPDSPAFVAALLWGGAAGRGWFRSLHRQLEDEKGLMDTFERLDHLLAKADPSDLSEGDLVQWDSSGGMAFGRIDAIAMSGSLESSLRDEPMEGSEDEPAIRTELVDRVDGEIEGRGETVLHRAETLMPASEDDVKAKEPAGKKTAVGERRVLSFETKDFSVKEDTEDEFVFDALGAVFGNKDRGGDILKKGSFKRTIDHNDGRFPLIADHDFTMKSRLGVAYASEETQGVRVKGHINTETQSGREVASHIRHAEKHGLPMGMSFGYEVVKDDFDDEKNARLLKEVKAYEFTVTQIPMNPEARVESVQGMKALLDHESKQDLIEDLAGEVVSLLKEDPELRSTLTEALDTDTSTDSGAAHSDADEVTKDIESLINSIRQTHGTD